MNLTMGFGISIFTLILCTVPLSGVRSLHIHLPSSIKGSKGLPTATINPTATNDKNSSLNQLRYQQQRINETYLNMNDDERKDNENDGRTIKQGDKELRSKSGKGGEEDTPTDLFYIEEPRLLLGDIVSMLLTCQLLGLVDVLNTPAFWDSGGFAQPVDLSPEGVSTLGTLVKRDSVMSIAWVLSSIRNRGYTFGTVVDDLTAIKCSFTIFTDYCSILIIFALTTAFITHSQVDSVEILRQSYYTIFMLCTFRVVYGRCNR